MNTFYRNIQPTIVKFSDDELIPEHLRCHYAINYNVWGIDYFFENYLLQEGNDGIFMILNENNFNFILEDSLSDQNAIDIPRLYIMITDEFMADGSKFQEFILKAAKDNEIYSTGIEGFRPNEQYYINQTLFNYLGNINAIATEQEVDPDSNDTFVPSDIQLPNYLDSNGNITKYFIDLSDELIKDYTNLEYYNKKNNLIEKTYSEDELNMFYQSVCKIILNNTTIQLNSEIFNKTKNQIYDKVLNYYANSQIDDASIALQLILGSNYGTVTYGMSSCCNTGCGSNTTGSTQSGTYLTESCASLYQQAMPLYLKQMFGDTEFYEDWFCVYLNDKEKIPNDILIEALILFLKEFMDLDYNLDMNSKGKSYQCDCTNQLSLNNSSLEYKKLNNYIQVLLWVYNNEITENTNKIKVYGEQFGELLPKLQF